MRLPAEADINQDREMAGITVSTAGLAARLNDVAALGVNLAILLNGTTEEQRRQLMPAVSQIASLKTLMSACRRYPLAPTRRLTFEYVLLAGVNDRDEDAHRLVTLLKGIRCKVNLIPFNEFPGSAYRRPTDRNVLSFQRLLTQARIDAFIRKSGAGMCWAPAANWARCRQARLPLP